MLWRVSDRGETPWPGAGFPIASGTDTRARARCPLFQRTRPLHGKAESADASIGGRVYPSCESERLCGRRCRRGWRALPGEARGFSTADATRWPRAWGQGSGLPDPTTAPHAGGAEEDGSKRMDRTQARQPAQRAAFPGCLPTVGGVATVDAVGIDAVRLDELPATNDDYAGTYTSGLCV